MSRSRFLVQSFSWSFLTFVLALSAHAQFKITTVAGNGPNNVPATTAGLHTATGTVTDINGNIYIASCDSDRVYKVTPSGTLTIFAGNGAAAFQGDGGPAVNAALNFITGLAIDSAGNIYIADTENNRVRVVRFGVISTLAGNGIAGFRGDGGTATAAELNLPTGVAVDSAGNVYIADSGNNRIRKVSAGTISTVAGNGTACAFSTNPCGDSGPATAAQLTAPAGVAVDASANIFIADSGDNRIRKVTSGTITTVAGTGVGGFSGDGGSATAAELNFPQAVFVDTLGNIFIADTANNRIREVVAGLITTAAGNGTAGFSGDGALATNAELDFPLGVYVNTAGAIFISDSFNDRTREVIGGIINTIAGNGSVGFSGDGGLAFQTELGFPDGAVSDSSGNVFITDSADNRVREVVNSTGIIMTVAGNGTAGFSGDGGPATSAKVNFPDALAFDTSGNLFIADALNNVIRKVTPSGTISTVAGNGTACSSSTSPCGDGGPATLAQLNFAGGIVLDSAGNLLIADILDNRIRKVSASTGNISTVAGTGTACSGTLASCGDGGLAINAQLNAPEYVALDQSGNFFIADSGDNAIREVAVSTGTISTVAGNGTAGFTGNGGLAISAELNFPESVGVDRSGNLFIADTANNAVRRVTASNGIITTVAGNSSGIAGFSGDGGLAPLGKLDSPEAVFSVSANKFFVADTFTGRIRVVANTLAPTALNLGTWIIGTRSSPAVLTLTNTGTTPLTVASIAFSGTNASDFSQTNNCIGPAINPGLSCVINVVLTPSALGLRTATITVTDNLNNVSGSTQSASLTGGGDNFVLTSTPTANTVTRPNSATYTLHVQPQGGFTGTVSLTCTGNPANTTCSISPTSVTIVNTTQNATLTLATRASSPTGTFTFKANGSFTDVNSVTTTRTVTLTITIQ